jgi:hypothetical protein
MVPYANPIVNPLVVKRNYFKNKTIATNNTSELLINSEKNRFNQWGGLDNLNDEER